MVSSSTLQSSAVYENTATHRVAAYNDKGSSRLIAVGTVGGKLMLFPWPCRLSATAPLNETKTTHFVDEDGCLGESVKNETSPQENFHQLLSIAPETLRDGVACVSVSAGNTFVLAFSGNRTTVFQYRYVSQSTTAVFDPHVEALTYFPAVLPPRIDSGSSSVGERSRNAQHGRMMWQGPNIAPLLRNRNGQLLKNGAMGGSRGLYVGQPNWMKDFSSEGRDHELRLSIPDTGLQSEYVFGCDGRGFGCCAVVARVDQSSSGWLGDILWFSGSIAVIHNAKTGLLELCIFLVMYICSVNVFPLIRWSSIVLPSSSSMSGFPVSILSTTFLM
jgi:hypothetical protein